MKWMFSWERDWVSSLVTDSMTSFVLVSPSDLPSSGEVLKIACSYIAIYQKSGSENPSRETILPHSVPISGGGPRLWSHDSNFSVSSSSWPAFPFLPHWIPCRVPLLLEHRVPWSRLNRSFPRRAIGSTSPGQSNPGLLSLLCTFGWCPRWNSRTR